jgi:hypothetical protein
MGQRTGLSSLRDDALARRTANRTMLLRARPPDALPVARSRDVVN